MQKLYSPENDVELAIIMSILNGEEIQFFVHNDHFGNLEVGPKIDLFNAKTIMVSEDQYDRARELIEDFLSSIAKTESPTQSSYSWRDKIRMAIETVFMAWFVPGNKWGKQRWLGK